MLLTDQTSSNSVARTLAARPSWIVPLEVTTTFSVSPSSRSLLLDCRVILLVTAHPEAAHSRTTKAEASKCVRRVRPNLISMLTPKANSSISRRPKRGPAAQSFSRGPRRFFIPHPNNSPAGAARIGRPASNRIETKARQRSV